jgi:L-ectoine synthase
MKVRTIEEIKYTDRHVHGEGFESLRLLLAKDGMGFSVHKTIIPPGPPRHWHYTHHLEACYCIQGMGTLTNLTTGAKYTIRPDTIYILDNHDDHTFQAQSEVVLISIFNPPVTGREIHNADGSYTPSEQLENV